MATPNYVLLERYTVGAAGTAAVTFNNIPQTGYTDLKVVVSARDNKASAGNWLGLKFNGSTSGYSSKWLEGNGSGTPGSFAGPTTYGYVGVSNSSTATGNTFASMDLYIPNYTSSNYKSYSAETVYENNATAATMEMGAGLWSNSAAITSITFTPDSSSSLVQYSTFSIYALAAVGTTPVIAPYASGGDIIETDGTYWYHAFISSGSFTPRKALSCDVLVVAGGGGGGTTNGNQEGGGGGGAGGVLGFASQALAANTAITATVGAGGAAQTNGNNSLFGALTTVIGGGAGANNSGSTPANGGSGGGSGGGYSTYGTGTSGQGNNGGIATGSQHGSGGGGAGGAGGTGATAGAGGASVNTYTGFGSLTTALSTLGLGVSGYLAGGGGGGGAYTGTIYPGGSTGGTATGGGGAGGNGNSGAGNNATPNTGGGGGGASGYGATGGAGGSGLIILRYAI